MMTERTSSWNSYDEVIIIVYKFTIEETIYGEIENLVKTQTTTGGEGIALLGHIVN